MKLDKLEAEFCERSQALSESLLWTRSDPTAAAQPFEELGRWLLDYGSALADPARRRGLARELRQRLLASVLSHNQFSIIEPERERAIERIFVATLEAVAGLAASAGDVASLTAALAAPFALQTRELGALLAQELASAAVVSAEYSAELQLSLLGLSLAELLPPVLDLGCGQRATLVEAIKAHGIDATGLDRLAGPSLLRADWLTYAPPQDHYGTIISHQAFSLHFLRQHLTSDEGALCYAHKYMELLRALRRGGSFAYTPGLPFIEQHLTAEFRSSRRALPEPLKSGLGEVFGIAVGDVAYAAVVTRR